MNNIDKLLRTLQDTISFNFQKRFGTYDEPLFHLPPNYEKSNIQEKIKLSLDIAEQLYSSIRNASILYRPSLYESVPEGNVYALPKTSDEIIDRLLDMNSDKLQMEQWHIRQLGQLIIGAVRDSASHSLRTQLAMKQDAYERLALSLAEAKKRLRQSLDDKEKLLDVNIRLKSKNKALKQYHSSLEQQLEDCLYEKYLNEEQFKNVRDELVETRSSMQKIIESGGSDLNFIIRPSTIKSR